MPSGCAAIVLRSVRTNRITDWMLARLAALDADPYQELIEDEPFFVYRTSANPRFLDLSLDPSDRLVARNRRMSLRAELTERDNRAGARPMIARVAATWVGRAQNEYPVLLVKQNETLVYRTARDIKVGSPTACGTASVT
jgi:hypothetical protein